MDVGAIASWSALVAAGATVVGAVLLALFFGRGEPWGTLNDIASIVLMLATIPVAVRLAAIEAANGANLAGVAAAIGILGMVGASIAQLALVLRLGTYRGLLPYALGAGALVGIWYLLVALLGAATGMPLLLAVLAIAAGLGFLMLGYGFWRFGEERHPVSILGGIWLLIGSTGFLGWVGIALGVTEALSA
jgi:hypothetical protein